jgi:hypothetical protein
MEIDDLKTLLKDQSIEPQDIKPLRLRETNSYVNQSVYLLYFEAGKVKLAELQKVKTINNLIVRWEQYQPRSFDQMPQCRKCQMYGHSSVNCNMPTRCLVCADAHVTDDCSKKKKRAVLEHMISQNEQPDRSFIKCANCNGNHTANFRGCIARQTYKQIQQRYTQSSSKKRPPPPPPPPVYDDVNYPQIFGVLPKHTNQSQQSWNKVVAGEQPQVMHNFNQQLQQQMQMMTQMMSSMNTMISNLTSLISQLSTVLASNVPLPMDEHDDI